jgi:hypothetical protein
MTERRHYEAVLRQRQSCVVVPGEGATVSVRNHHQREPQTVYRSIGRNQLRVGLQWGLGGVASVGYQTPTVSGLSCPLGTVSL